MKCLRFKFEVPYIVNFRKPFSTITLLSYPFPPYTTLRGMLANALGLGDLGDGRDDYNISLSKLRITLKPLNFPEKSQNLVLMKKLKPPANSKQRREVLQKMGSGDLGVGSLDKKEREIYEAFKRPENTSAPFVKEYLTPVCGIVYILGEENELLLLKDALEVPKRPLYLGGSDDFVIISEISPLFEATPIMSDELDSIVRVDKVRMPIDRTSILGRVPYKFRESSGKKRTFFREDAIIAAPKPSEKLKLTGPIDCFCVNGEYVSF